jgi:NTP pyrophosphatase (non-canonical NTP hydrolase)
MSNIDLAEIVEQAKKVIQKYREDFPDVQMDRDYLPLKVTEEWGECLQTYLMLSDRGRQKGKSKEEIKEMLAQEFADVFAYLLLFADSEGIDPIQAIDKKWFAYLENK